MRIISSQRQIDARRRRAEEARWAAMAGPVIVRKATPDELKRMRGG